MTMRSLAAVALLTWGGLANACADEAEATGAERAHLDDLVAGDGSDYPPSVGASENAAPDVLAQVSAPACPPGAICRDADPRVEDLDRNGPYRFSSYNVPRGSDHGGATIFYPTDAQPPFAYALYCPPYTATRAAFSAWGPFFASHGIVLATMDTVTTGDYPPRRAKGIVEVMTGLRGENRRASSPLYEKLDESRGGVIGWSMGGGGVWIASGDHPEWKSAVTLAGHNITATGWQQSARRSTIPTLMMNGATDLTILGGLGQSDSAYRTIPESTPKLLYVFGLLGHFEWGSPTAGGRAVGRYVMAWEKTFLEGDERYREFLLQRGPGASIWQTNLR